MSEPSTRVALTCSSCSPDEETVHEVLSQGDGRATVRCTECSHVHKTKAEKEEEVEREVHGLRVRGLEVGPETRCAHYDTDRDVVALKFACCGTYYPCFQCHRATADHDAERLPVDSSESAVLCGVCGAELTPKEFVTGDHECPECGAAFNPGCADHYEQYFEFRE